jgi:hypothetical protein
MTSSDVPNMSIPGPGPSPGLGRNIAIIKVLPRIGTKPSIRFVTVFRLVSSWLPGVQPMKPIEVKRK